MFELLCPLGIIFGVDSNTSILSMLVAFPKDLWFNFKRSREILRNNLLI
jgi:hypothetical protein